MYVFDLSSSSNSITLLKSPSPLVRDVRGKKKVKLKRNDFWQCQKLLPEKKNLCGLFAFERYQVVARHISSQLRQKKIRAQRRL
jgi:hypothetical protein